MDFGKALLLMALVYVLIAFGKSLVPSTDSRVVQALAFVVGIAAVFLMAETVWANSQVIGEHTLDTLEFADKVVAGLFVGAGSTVIDRGIKAVRNIGENDTNPG